MTHTFLGACWVSDVRQTGAGPQEVGWALGQAIPIIMVRLGEDPKGFAGRYQAVSGGPKGPRESGSRILVTICGLEAYGPVVTERLVKSLREATTTQRPTKQRSPAGPRPPTARPCSMLSPPPTLPTTRFTGP